jgi:uncharacterized LabA/DUF88 family protein
MKKAAILIDGGYLRAISKKAGKIYNPDFIEKFASGCKETDEEILRILYYDCARYEGYQKLPVSGNTYHFTASHEWLTDLSKRNLFAIRRGVLKFRGYKPKSVPVNPSALNDSDFEPDFEQKGVDMRIGLDIAVYSENRATDRIVLISNDTDCVPALKHGRRAGLQMVIIQLPNTTVAPELLAHVDYKRSVSWP